MERSRSSQSRPVAVLLVALSAPSSVAIDVTAAVPEVEMQAAAIASVRTLSDRLVVIADLLPSSSCAIKMER
jgi:hypothetical protein